MCRSLRTACCGLTSNDIRVQVSGGKFFLVDAFVAYRIADPRVFRLAVSGNLDNAQARLRTRLDNSLRQVYGLRGFEAALSEERPTMMKEVRDQLRPDATSLGLEIVDVRIRRTDLTQEVSQQTFERMKAERLAEAERLRARGNENAQRTRAVADRQVVEIVAEARKGSEILRGEGDGERNSIFAAAFNKDPEFFAFYRSMQAYASSLHGSGTSMVLSPDSEFFNFFRDVNGTSAQKPIPTAPAPHCRNERLSDRRRTCSGVRRHCCMADFRRRQNGLPPRPPGQDEGLLRRAGLAAMVIGLGIVWLVRG